MSARPAILVVEDDEAFRYATSRFLRAKGYLVVDVPSSMEALREAGHGHFDVAIVDVTLHPGEPHGVSFARMIRHKDPDTRILFVTANLDIKRFEPDLPGEVLYKPVDPADLFNKVQELLT